MAQRWWRSPALLAFSMGGRTKPGTFFLKFFLLHSRPTFLTDWLSSRRAQNLGLLSLAQTFLLATHWPAASHALSSCVSMHPLSNGAQTVQLSPRFLRSHGLYSAGGLVVVHRGGKATWHCHVAVPWSHEQLNGTNGLPQCSIVSV